MKSIIYSLTAVLFVALFASCESTNPYDQTVFRLEEGPRSSQSGSRPRFGYGSEQEAREARRRTASRSRTEPATTNRGETRTLRNDSIDGDSGDGVADRKPEKPADDGSTADTGSSSDVADTEPKVEMEKETTTSSNPDTLKPTDTGSAPPATPVPGKYGHVYSPYASGREVDVTGFPPGTKVKCPYTQKVFLVP
jgi:hypothetical protein